LSVMNYTNSDNIEFSIELKYALNAVEKSTDFLNYLRNKSVDISPSYKLDKSPVTIADYGSQIIILNFITKKFPIDNFITEENLNIIIHNDQYYEVINKLVKQTVPEIDIKKILSYENKNRTADRIWAIDPLDGTKGYIADRQYSVAIALIENQKVIVGVLACPKMYKLISKKYNDRKGYVFFAEKGKGAFVKALSSKLIKKIKVNSKNKFAKILYAESFDNSHINISTHHKFSNILNINRPPLKVDGQIKYSLVAAGDISFYLRFPQPLNYKEYIWDHAAGQLIVEEAGGTVTDVLGNDFCYEKSIKLLKNTGIIASNGLIHEKLVKVASLLV